MTHYNPFQVVDEFEKIIAEWSGARFGVAVESCSAALFLSCVYRQVKEVSIPRFTYPSVPCSIIHAGGTVKFDDRNWHGLYSLIPYEIWDGALRFRKDMFMGGLHCLSFHMKKLLPIGRGGMILTNDPVAYEWLKRVRFDGRRQVPLQDDNFDMLGWNMYMEPEQAARGLRLFSTIDQRNLDDLDVAKQGYPDLSIYAIYQTSHNGGCRQPAQMEERQDDAEIFDYRTETCSETESPEVVEEKLKKYPHYHEGQTINRRFQA